MCGGKISKQAFECPLCGHPLRTRSIVFDVALGIIMATVLILLGYAIFHAMFHSAGVTL